MRKRNRKAKRMEKKGKREKRETVLREKMEGNEKEGKGRGRISRVSGGRRSKVRGLKLVHAAGSTCGRQKSWSFNKLQEVGYFNTRFIFSLKAL